MIRVMTCIALLMLSNVASAELMRCEGCSQKQMYVMGERVIKRKGYKRLGAVPPVYVINVRDNAVVKVMYGHNVDAKFDWEVDEFKIQAWTTPAEKPVVDAVAVLHTRLSSARLVLTSDDGIASSVYDVIQRPSLDDRVSSALENGWAGVGKGLLDPLRIFNPLPSFDVSALSPTITVTFPDRSSAQYRFDYEKDRWARQRGTARDADGNAVPETVADVTGGGIRVYEFKSASSESFQDFRNTIKTYEFDIKWERGSGTGVGVVCAGSTCSMRRFKR